MIYYFSSEDPLIWAIACAFKTASLFVSFWCLTDREGIQYASVYVAVIYSLSCGYREESARPIVCHPEQYLLCSISAKSRGRIIGICNVWLCAQSAHENGPIAKVKLRNREACCFREQRKAITRGWLVGYRRGLVIKRNCVTVSEFVHSPSSAWQLSPVAHYLILAVFEGFVLFCSRN